MNAFTSEAGLDSVSSQSHQTVQPGYLDINALVSLRCLEVATWGFESATAACLQWISTSMQTVEPEQRTTRFRDLRVNILPRHSDGADAVRCWKEMFRGWEWPVLLLARVSGFRIPQRTDGQWKPGMPLSRVETVTPLGRWDGQRGTILDSGGLWKGSCCPGWL